MRTAGYYLHNFLWWKVDAEILRNPKFVVKVQKAIRKVGLGVISNLLMEVFRKEELVAKEVVEFKRFRFLLLPRGLLEIFFRDIPPVKGGYYPVCSRKNK